jgi:hypothetical protein
VDEKGVLVAGAGIPDGWAKKPMKVEGIATKAGVAAWSWDGRKMTATLDGKAVQARAGRAFSAQPQGSGAKR